MKKKVLIIGSSKTIKRLSKLLFAKYGNLYYLNFRNAWKTKIKKKYDLIILTGFHYNICYLNKKELQRYINDYYLFLLTLKKNCKKIIFISTYLNISYSFCRVVYFYYKLIREYKLLKNNKIKIYNFKKIINMNFYIPKYIQTLLKLFNLETLESVVQNFDNNEVKKINKIKFNLINIPRTRFIDRVLRIF